MEKRRNKTGGRGGAKKKKGLSPFQKPPIKTKVKTFYDRSGHISKTVSRTNRRVRGWGWGEGGKRPRIRSERERKRKKERKRKRKKKGITKYFLYFSFFFLIRHQISVMGP